VTHLCKVEDHLMNFFLHHINKPQTYELQTYD
jgi:hypothetical protein